MNHENATGWTSVAFRVRKQAIIREQERTILSSFLLSQICENKRQPYNIYYGKCQGGASPPIEDKLINQKANSPNSHQYEGN